MLCLVLFFFLFFVSLRITSPTLPFAFRKCYYTGKLSFFFFIFLGWATNELNSVAKKSLGGCCVLKTPKPNTLSGYMLLINRPHTFNCSAGRFDASQESDGNYKKEKIEAKKCSEKWKIKINGGNLSFKQGGGQAPPFEHVELVCGRRCWMEI